MSFLEEEGGEGYGSATLYITFYAIADSSYGIFLLYPLTFIMYASAYCCYLSLRHECANLTVSFACIASAIPIPVPFQIKSLVGKEHHHTAPPLTLSTCPLIQRLCSALKKRTTSATSSGVPIRFAGLKPAIILSIGSGLSL